MIRKKTFAKGLSLLAVLFLLSTNTLAQEPCKADFDCSGGVDSGDVGTFLAEWNHRTIYSDPCPCVETSCPCSTVYTCEGTLSSLGRWCDQGDGTVKDMTTGVVWLQDAGWGGLKRWADCSTWDDAHTRAGTLYDGMSGEPAGLSDGSVEGDWRLPTKSELVGITVGDEYIRSSQMYFFTNVQSNYYWSSTTYAGNTNGAWSVGLYSGGVGSGNKDTYDGYYVWPVRGGQ